MKVLHFYSLEGPLIVGSIVSQLMATLGFAGLGAVQNLANDIVRMAHFNRAGGGWFCHLSCVPSMLHALMAQGDVVILSLTKRLAMSTIAGLLLVLGSARAATPTTLVGTNFDIVYDAGGLGLFGTPTLSGNTLFFTPTNFKAESLNGQGIVTANQTIVFDIVPHLGYTITGSLLTERGDYLLRHASSLVDVQGQTRGFAIANPLAEVNDNITATAPLTTLNVSTNWEANSFLNLSALQADSRGYRITIENLLFAYTEAGSGPRQAFIEKKFAGETMSLQVVGAVPEPEQWAMLLIGLGMLGWTARRRTNIAV